MTALRKQPASAFEHKKNDAAELTDTTNVPDALAYDDDVTPEGIEAVKKRVEGLLPKGNWKVIDGYAGDRLPAVG